MIFMCGFVWLCLVVCIDVFVDDEVVDCGCCDIIVVMCLNDVVGLMCCCIYWCVWCCCMWCTMLVLLFVVAHCVCVCWCC